MGVTNTSDQALDGDLSYRVRIEADRGELFDAVVSKAIADAKGMDPTEVSFQLYDHIDPDALEELFDHSNRKPDVAWEIEFSVDELDVVVSSDGLITVY